MGKLHNLAAGVLERSRDVTGPLSHCPTPIDAGTAGQRDKRPEGEDWQGYFEERAAIAEHNGGLSRSMAEASALDQCVTRWLHLNAPKRRGSPEDCAHCGDGVEGGRLILPYGVETVGGVAWVHATCWRSWQDQRRKQAMAALALRGVAPLVDPDAFQVGPSR